MAPRLPHHERRWSSKPMYGVIPRSFFIAGILAAALSAQPRLIRGPIQDLQRVRMTGHFHPMAKVENDLGPLDASVALPTITLVLGQTPEQRAELDRLLAGLPPLARSRAIRRSLRRVARRYRQDHRLARAAQPSRHYSRARADFGGLHGRRRRYRSGVPNQLPPLPHGRPHPLRQ